MHRKPNIFKRLALLLCLVLLMATAASPTLAILMTRTQSIVNTFLSGFAPTGSLTISKQVDKSSLTTSPAIPSTTTFQFTVDLGTANAGEQFGDFTADSSGILTIEIHPDIDVTIPDIPAGTEVTVTETRYSKGYTPNETSQTVTIQRDLETKLNFVNFYHPLPAPTDDLTVTVNKVLDGRDPAEDDKFPLTLQAWNGTDWTDLETQIAVYNTETGKFDTLDFSQAIQSHSFDTDGDHKFRIVETVGDNTVEFGEFYVHVTDKTMDGVLEIDSLSAANHRDTAANINGLNLQLTLTNRSPSPNEATVSIQIKKTITDTANSGRGPEGFAFILTDVTDPENEKEKAISGLTDINGDTSIEVTYGTEDVGKTFQYVLKERNDGLSTIAYDTTEYRYQVEVFRDSAGNVTAEITDITNQSDTEAEDTPSAENPPSQDTTSEESTNVQPEDDTPDTLPGDEQAPVQPSAGSNSVIAKFTNTFDPADVSIPISGTKTLTTSTRRTLKDGEFTFQLFESGGTEAIRTATNQADGSFQFDPLVFDKVGTYTYIVKEDTSAPLTGFTYDSRSYQIKFEVTRNKNTLEVSYRIYDSSNKEVTEIVFENSYAPLKDTLTISGTKKLTGRDLKDKEFTFNLYEATYLTSYGFTKGELYARSTNGTAQSTNDNEGSFSFEITYPEEGTFYYILTEANTKDENITYDETQYGLTVKVEDRDGQLKAYILQIDIIGSDETVQDIVFHNTYTAPDIPDETTQPEESTPSESTPPTGSGTPTDTKLPQTGQLWWPVPILLILGVLLVLIGLIRRRGAYHE